MSLYGTGRAEGFAAAVLIGTVVLLVQALRQLQLHGLEPGALEPALAAAALPALGGILCYRFLRGHGRSRYGAFLGGAGYALAPWLTAIALVPREQLAAALAPLALEVASRCALPAQRRKLLPAAPFGLAAPFLAGPSVVALLAAGIASIQLLGAAIAGELGDRLRLLRRFAVAGLGAGIVGASLWRIDVFGPWLASTAAPRAAAVIAAHRPTAPGIDLPALLRLAGPVLLMFAALGVLRQQRHATLWRWMLVALLGGLPTLAKLWWTPPPHGLLAVLPSAAFWLSVLAITMLGTAGLDDFLDHPQRRRTALPWLLALAVLGAPLVPLAAFSPAAEWPLTVTILLLAALLPTWRRVGILRFKNVLATATVAALVVPALQVPIPPRPTTPAWSAPLGETAPWQRLSARPRWHYSGLGVVLLCSLGAALWSACRRSQTATAVPAKAKAAITKKARPPKRS